MLANCRVTAARAAPPGQRLGRDTASLRLWEEAQSKLWWSKPAACPGQGAAGKDGDVLPAGTVQGEKTEKVG